MSSLYDILKDVINEKAHIPFDFENNCLVIDEKANTNENELQSVVFDFGRKANQYTFHFAFELDNNEASFLGKLFRWNLDNIRKAVDAVVLCEKNNQKYIFLIELKSYNYNMLDLRNKFKSSILFVNYLNEYLKVYQGLNFDDFKVVSIVFDRKVNKEVQFNERYGFYHQGFSNTNGKTYIRKFID